MNPAESDLERADETEHHHQELGTTKMGRRSTHNKLLRPPKLCKLISIVFKP